MNPTDMKPNKCCFCGKEFFGWGNNPWPARKDYTAVCCNECNITVVIPARIEQVKKEYKNYGTEQSK
jgi:hypothetical protein